MWPFCINGHEIRGILQARDQICRHLLTVVVDQRLDGHAHAQTSHMPLKLGVANTEGDSHEAAHEAQTPGQQRPWRGAEGVQFAQDVPQEKGRQHIGYCTQQAANQEKEALYRG